MHGYMNIVAVRRCHRPSSSTVRPWFTPSCVRRRRPSFVPVVLSSVVRCPSSIVRCRPWSVFRCCPLSCGMVPATFLCSWYARAGNLDSLRSIVGGNIFAMCIKECSYCEIYGQSYVVTAAQMVMDFSNKSVAQMVQPWWAKH